MTDARIVPQVVLEEENIKKNKLKFYKEDMLAYGVYEAAVELNSKFTFSVGNSADITVKGNVHKFGIDGIITFWDNLYLREKKNHFGDAFCIGIKTLGTNNREYSLNFEPGFAFHQVTRSGLRPYYQFESNQETIQEAKNLPYKAVNKQVNSRLTKRKIVIPFFDIRAVLREVSRANLYNKF